MEWASLRPRKLSLKPADEFKILNLIYQTEEDNVKSDEMDADTSINSGQKKPDKEETERGFYRG